MSDYSDTEIAAFFLFIIGAVIIVIAAVWEKVAEKNNKNIPEAAFEAVIMVGGLSIIAAMMCLALG